jgi:hypothetical protein
LKDHLDQEEGMSVKQISISLENVPGKFSEVIEYLGQNGINVIGVSVADTVDISAVRFIHTLPVYLLSQI